MTQSTRTSEVLAESDYSYRNRRLTGDRWLLAGDAAGFIDPMFSTGVFVAIETAEQAADAVAEALQNERRRPAAFKKYERETNRVMDLYLRFVGNWYKPKFIEVMTHPVNRFRVGAGDQFHALGKRQEQLHPVVENAGFLPGNFPPALHPTLSAPDAQPAGQRIDVETCATRFRKGDARLRFRRFQNACPAGDCGRRWSRTPER